MKKKSWQEESSEACSRLILSRVDNLMMETETSVNTLNLRKTFSPSLFFISLKDESSSMTARRVLRSMKILIIFKVQARFTGEKSKSKKEGTQTKRQMTNQKKKTIESKHRMKLSDLRESL